MYIHFDISILRIQLKFVQITQIKFSLLKILSILQFQKFERTIPEISYFHRTHVLTEQKDSVHFNKDRLDEVATELDTIHA